MSYLDGRRSTFPERGVDQFLELYDLPASERGNMKRYQELTLKDGLTTPEQSELNNLTIVLQHYIVDVEKWNKFADAIVNLEVFFLSETEPYLQAKKDEITNYTNTKILEANTKMLETTDYVDTKILETTDYVDTKILETTNYVNTKTLETTNYVDTKKVEFQAEVDKLNYRGEWQPGVQYYKKNIVTSSGDGFIAKLDSINQSPPIATHWGKIGGKGEKGDPSLNINFKGAYDVAMSYVMGDAVTFGGLWYYAKQNTKGNPPTNVTYWELQTNQTLVSDTQPFDSRITGWVDTTL